MKSRLAYLSPEERKRIASLGGKANTKRAKFEEGCIKSSEAGRKGGLERARRARERALEAASGAVQGP